MQLDLSFFADPYVDSLSACGIVKSPEADRLNAELLEKQLVVHARQNIPNRPIWLRLLANTQKSPTGIHFHLDLASESYFTSGPPPDDLLDADRLSRSLELFRGLTAAFNLTARYSFPRSELPADTVVNLLLKISVGPMDANANLIGSSYRFNSGSVREVRWRLQGDNIRVAMDAPESRTINEDVFAAVLDPSRSVLRKLIFEQAEA